ncbi:GNAT family N-acetyltransferase [Paracrocinitomix mangrovi]|uniref:GNAT family N-acetyltransferase n=1 Tax=Paracrocinitomix mangrovi TaxID=2862509 RepID=UPI001C8E23EB|nr:GNAT family N-acetyltransferase [Paracrocinitomix mangrovi]UKN02307.1 GNAT family N-acetyltransferase [Paracrocinitomix mangrovi]
MLTVFSAKDFRLTEEQFATLYDIIIHAYRETESEIWGENYVRVSEQEFGACIDRDEILVAFLDGKVVGGIRYFHLRDKTWTFSLLGADFNQKGKGIGRALIDAVEEKVKEKGGDRIHIEVLRAEDIDVESKNILSNWYQRLGYDLVKTIDVFEVYDDADKWNKLANPSVFDCYLKAL